jgi:hypothetical protein
MTEKAGEYTFLLGIGIIILKSRSEEKALYELKLC